MSAPHHRHRDAAAGGSPAAAAAATRGEPWPEDQESQPLLRPMSGQVVGGLCTCTVVLGLAVSWCILDYWNRQVSNDLSKMGDLKMLVIDRFGVPVGIQKPFKSFSYPLTLAFLQFIFMGVFFLMAHYFMTKQHPGDIRLGTLARDKRWPVLVVTHVFGTFWLQALMMPAQVLSLGLFAASHALEIPIAAAVRSQVLGVQPNKRTLTTVGITCLAAGVVFYSYAELAGCVCIWSGNGVALTGLVFWIVYMLLLAVPSVNVVLQEGLLLQPGVHPMLLLALQNLLACVFLIPIMLVCHVVGWEDVGDAFAQMVKHSQVWLMILWLCAQMAATSAICIMLLQVTNSFWTVALRALRVVFWGLLMLGYYYMLGPGVLLSMSCPHSSFWAFIMFCGVALGSAAVYLDSGKAQEEVPREMPKAVSTKKGPSAAAASGESA